MMLANSWPSGVRLKDELRISAPDFAAFSFKRATFSLTPEVRMRRLVVWSAGSCSLREMVMLNSTLSRSTLAPSAIPLPPPCAMRSVCSL